MYLQCLQHQVVQFYSHADTGIACQRLSTVQGPRTLPIFVTSRSDTPPAKLINFHLKVTIKLTSCVWNILQTT